MSKLTADSRAYINTRYSYLCAIGSLIVALLLTGCSSLNIESAKNLGALGKESATLSIGSIFVSNNEYIRAMDAEAFFHGYAGTAIPQQLSKDYQRIQQELAARSIVFTKLGETYEAFYNLALLDSADGVASAINGLGDAVNGYAKTLNKKSALVAADKDSIARIGGLVALRIQRRRVAKSSGLIRTRLEVLAELLADPLVKVQMTTFNQNLTASRAAALTVLWEKGVLDPTPLITELGIDAGLKAGKDALKIIASPDGTHLKDGLSLVIKTRMARRTELIEQGYDASIRIIRELIAKHVELENGGELTPTELRQIIAELQLITDCLNPKVAF